MLNAITYKDIYLSLPGFLYIRKLEIQEWPGKHGSMYVEAVMVEETDEFAFYEIPKTISIHYRNQGIEQILFQGVISQCSLKAWGNYQVLKIQAQDATYWMDIDKKNRCFQNTNQTVADIIGEIMSEYEENDSICNIPDEPVGELLFQYEETDWEFLNRLLSKYHECLYSSAIFPTIHYQAGVSIQEEAVNWDGLSYRKKKDFGRLEYLKQNGFDSLLSANFTVYNLECYDIVSLGSQIFYKGRPWYVSGIRRIFRNGLLVNDYELRQKESMMAERYYNSRITGISVYAIVADTQRDRVQVIMQEEALGESCYWFPFSSVSSSSDGSGWYCMPEKGESVRIYFPTEREQESYVITCIQGHAPSGAGDPMGNPAVRSISTETENLVQFSEAGILIEAKKGGAKVSLGKDGEACIYAPGGIDLSSEEKCSFETKTMECEAVVSLQIQDDAGAGIIAGPAGMFLNGQEIYEN